MDAVDLEAWMLKASALASSVAASDADHDNVRAVASWLLKTYEGVAAVREKLRQARAVGYAEAIEKAVKRLDRERDEIMHSPSARSIHDASCVAGCARLIRALAPADKDKP